MLYELFSRKNSFPYKSLKIYLECFNLMFYDRKSFVFGKFLVVINLNVDSSAFIYFFINMTRENNKYRRGK